MISSTAGQELIVDGLSRVAERAGDITPTVFERYFADCEDSRELMSHMDEHMLGRMLDQVLLLVMEPGEDELESYLAFETANHRGYGVRQHMYVNLFSALRSVIADALAGDFSTELAAALDARCNHLLQRIELASA